MNISTNTSSEDNKAVTINAIDMNKSKLIYPSMKNKAFQLTKSCSMIHSTSSGFGVSTGFCCVNGPQVSLVHSGMPCCFFFFFKLTHGSRKRMVDLGPLLQVFGRARPLKPNTMTPGVESSVRELFGSPGLFLPSYKTLSSP